MQDGEDTTMDAKCDELSASKEEIMPNPLNLLN